MPENWKMLTTPVQFWYWMQKGQYVFTFVTDIEIFFFEENEILYFACETKVGSGKYDVRITNKEYIDKYLDKAFSKGYMFHVDTVTNRYKEVSA